MQQQFVATDAILQNEILSLLESWDINANSVKILCTPKKRKKANWNKINELIT